ncbi:hypothetical protein [Paracoccus sp. (in: a-proteobacteria)]|uniref:hypothetical protein n=1 Tax=Paracoccus sp. TaxID=267 RepID=UPI002AFE0B0A|nr:hypothetical protein [Paracoccus sp. (in: a-proteobacteria)]
MPGTQPHTITHPAQPAPVLDETPAIMANVMREQYAAKGYCDAHDLARAGFCEAQILENIDAALRLAGPADTIALPEAA